MLLYTAGTIKKWHHHRGSMTHGSKSKRQHGSIGSSATPSRVLPGLKMAGQLGNKRRTIKGLQVCSSPASVSTVYLMHLCEVQSGSRGASRGLTQCDAPHEPYWLLPRCIRYTALSRYLLPMFHAYGY